MANMEMMDMFRNIYTEYKELKKRYVKAAADDNWELAESVAKEGVELMKSLGDDSTDIHRIYDMYADAWDNGSMVIEVSRSMFEKERNEMIRLFKDNSIDAFMYSSQSTGLMEDVWEFVQAGWKVAGMCQTAKGKPAFMLKRAY